MVAIPPELEESLMFTVTEWIVIFAPVEVSDPCRRPSCEIMLFVCLACNDRKLTSCDIVMLC